MQDRSLACFQATSDIAAIERHNRQALDQSEHWRQKSYFGAGDRGRLVGSNGGAAAEFPLEYPYPRFDRLPDGGWIVASARCLPGEFNARRLTARGDLVTRFAVGDAVEQVQTDQSGGVWVSHFDEGTDELGSAGIAYWNSSGQRAWGANAVGMTIPTVWDCYALNSIGDVAWACYYSDFPIVRLRPDGEARVWTNDVVGAAALAVDGNHVVLFGGYEEYRQRIALLQLGSRAATLVGELTLAAPEVSRSQSVGRGDTIHIIGENAWRRFTVAEIAAAVAAA